MPQLLSIIEIGGYPDFSALYHELGYQTRTAASVRKALSNMKQQAPDVIVAEFNFQSDFRDRTSNLETLLATVRAQYPQCKVIALYEAEFAPAFARMQQTYPVDYALQFPVSQTDMRAALAALTAQDINDDG